MDFFAGARGTRSLKDNMPAHASFIGIFIALIFSVSMGNLLWWMLHPPKPVPLAAAKVRVSMDAIKTILVPSIGRDYSERGIELACRLGLEQKATIQLVHIVEVPLSLPLGAELPEQEKVSQEVLQRGKEIVETRKLTVELRSERSRFAGEKIAYIVQNENIGLIVMGIQPKLGGIESIIGRTTEMLLRKLPCEIIIDAKPQE